jgi:hypothetical protein
MSGEIYFSCKIDPSTAIFFQRVEYMLNAYKFLIGYILERKNFVCFTERLDEYEKEYMEISVEKDIALNEVVKQYIPEEFHTDAYAPVVDWNRNEVRVVDARQCPKFCPSK